MSKQTSKQPPSPADLIAACEFDIVRLEQERETHVARGVILAERRKAASYAAHVQHDPDSRKALDAINSEIGARASELQSFDDAIDLTALIGEAYATAIHDAWNQDSHCSGPDGRSSARASCRGSEQCRGTGNIAALARRSRNPSRHRAENARNSLQSLLP